MRLTLLFLALSVFLPTLQGALDPALEEGNKNLHAGDYEGAVARYTDYITAYPKDPAGYNDRALAYKLWRNYDQAIGDFDRSLRLRPDAFVYYNRAATYSEMGQEDKAVADYSTAIKRDSHQADFFLGRAHSYFNQETDALALTDLNIAIKLGVHEADAYVLRGILNKIQHRYDRSLADYEKAIQLEPDNARCYDVEAHLLSTCPAPKYRNGPKALTDATKACELTDWQNSSALETLAEAYAENGQFDEAIKWQRNAGEIDPEALAPKRIDFYEQKKPMRDLNRKEEPIPTIDDLKEKVNIRPGQKFSVVFDEAGDSLTNPRIVPKRDPKQSGIYLEYQKNKNDWVLLIGNDFRRVFHARCLARLKDYDTYFETDILPVGPGTGSRELWHEPMEEIVLTDFSLTDKKTE